MSLQKTDLINASWHNPPKVVSWTNDVLRFETDHKTDFWQDTWYGFRRDNGHFLGLDAPSDFSATLAFEGQYENLYDQAGIMIRIDENNWIKAGIEYSDDVTKFSTVVTKDGRSDWSMVAAPGQSGVHQVRLTRIKDAAFVHFLVGGDDWQLMRLAAFGGNHAILNRPLVEAFHFFLGVVLLVFKTEFLLILATADSGNDANNQVLPVSGYKFFE